MDGGRGRRLIVEVVLVGYGGERKLFGKKKGRAEFVIRLILMDK